MSKTHKSPGNDNDPFIIQHDDVRGDRCSPKQGGHYWQETFANDTRSRVGVRCSKCSTSGIQDHTKERNQLTGDYPLAK